jgi:accessory gene regulator protein AgrB
MQKPSNTRMIVYYINKASIVCMVIGLLAIVIGAVTRDNAPIGLIAVMLGIAIIGLVLYFITRAIWNGMDVADAVKKRRSK